MRVRVFAWQYHADPLRLADEVNECIKSCEQLGETVLDADVIIRSNDHASEKQEYLILIKYEGNRQDYVVADAPDEDGGEPG